MDDISSYIKNTVKRLGLSNRELGRILGCSPKDIRQVFNGNYKLSLSQFEKIAELNGTSVEEFLNSHKN